MSTLLELLGYAALVVAAHTLFGTGVAEAVAGVEVLLVAHAVEVREANIRTAVARLAGRVRRRKR